MRIEFNELCKPVKIEPQEHRTDSNISGVFTSNNHFLENLHKLSIIHCYIL